MVDVGPCQGPNCSVTVQAPDYINSRSLCTTCYDTFMASSSTTVALSDGRTATKVPNKNPKRRPRITIAMQRISLYPRWEDDDALFSYDISLFPSIVKSAAFPPTTTQFAHLDSCAGIGAGGGGLFYWVAHDGPV